MADRGQLERYGSSRLLGVAGKGAALHVDLDRSLRGFLPEPPGWRQVRGVRACSRPGGAEGIDRRDANTISGCPVQDAAASRRFGPRRR